MKSLIIVFLFCPILAAGCKDAHPQISKPALALASPTPIAQVAPSPTPLTAKEHWEAFHELHREKLHSPEDYAAMRIHLTAVANSKLPEKGKAVKALRYISNLEALMPTGENLKSALRICEDLSGAEISILTVQLKKSLHDPSSLQDFKVDKCVSGAPNGSSVRIQASYRAKNTYGALILSEEEFLAVRSTDGKTKYKALIWVAEK